MKYEQQNVLSIQSKHTNYAEKCPYYIKATLYVKKKWIKEKLKHKVTTVK